MKQIYQQLNSAQKQAVDTIEGPLLVLAGPGTGKTQLLSARVMRILELTDTPASSILCLTFTETGADNMRNRLNSFIGKEAYDVQINTYHGFAQSVIHHFPEYFYDQNLDQVADEITKYQFIHQLQDKMAKNNLLKNINAKTLLSSISDIKRSLLDSQTLLKVAEYNQQDLKQFDKQIHQLLKDIKRMPSKLDKAWPIYQEIKAIIQPLIEKRQNQTIKSVLISADQALTKAMTEAEQINKTTPLTSWKNSFLSKNDKAEWGFKKKQLFYWTTELADLHQKYQQKLTQHGLYDFDDMIIKVIDVINSQPELKFNLQEKYLYILLDEYQDTNKAQSKIIELITDNPVHEGRPNIMAVGDDDQAIYAFQGAEYSNMIDFYNRYKDTKVINLTNNYRSHDDIIAFAANISNQINNRLHQNINQSLTKQLIAANDNIRQAPVQIKRLDFTTQLDQNNWLATTIKKLIDSGEEPNQIAVLSTKHKFLESTTPYLANQQIPIRYQKKQNILEHQGVKAIITMSNVITKLAANHQHNAELFELLSYDFWQLETADIWQLNWQTERQQSLLQTMLNSPKQVIRQIALWLMQFALQTDKLSLEANLDLLIGNSKLTITDNEQSFDFQSPLRQFYLQNSAEETLNFALNVNILRSRLIEFTNNHPEIELKPLPQLLKMIQTYQKLDLPINQSNPYSEGEQAINLMTVFNAKGLEFKHVFMLNVNQAGWGKSTGGNRRVILPDNLEFITHKSTSEDEQLRQLFVAITRAKSNLYLLNPTHNLNNNSVKRLKFLNEIETTDNILARTLPEKYQIINNIKPDLNLELLQNNLLDNFTDWKNRHLETRLQYQDLLQDRINNLKLSPTSFNSFLDLIYGGPADFFIENVLRFPSTYDIRMTYGTLIHATLEQVQNVFNQKELFNDEQILQIFEQKLTETNLIETDKQTIRSWASKALPKFIKTRRKIFITSDNYQVKSEISPNKIVICDQAKLTGKIDRIEIDRTTKNITIVDYKTGKSHKTINKSDNSIYNNIRQLYFYKILLQSMPEYANYQINNWRLEYVSLDTEGEINYLAGEFETTELNKVKQLINCVWQEIQAFNFDQPDLPNTAKGRKDFEEYLLKKHSK